MTKESVIRQYGFVTCKTLKSTAAYLVPMFRFSGVLVYLALLLSLLASYLDARALQAVMSNTIFYAPGDNGQLLPYVELAWDINPTSLSWRKEQSHVAGKVIVSVIARNDTGIVYQDAYVLLTPQLASDSLIAFQRITDLKRFYVPEGKLHLRLELQDAFHQERPYVITDSLEVHQFAHASLSGIQLIDTILPVKGQGGVFQKNDRLQFPLCDNFFAEGRRQIHFYTEVYQDIASLQPLFVKSTVSKKGGSVFPDLVHIDTLQKKQIQFLDGTFYLGKLTSGNYLLNLVLLDSFQHELATARLFFQLENKKPDKEVKQAAATPEADMGITPVNVIDLNKTFVAKYSEAQIRAILKMLTPIADPSEKITIMEFQRKPDDMYARYFIYNFWNKRDGKNPVAAWETYTKLVKEVNKLFGSGGRPGYETERGQIYLMYGAPNERVVVSNEASALPYEIWMYDYLPRQQGKNVLIFYRPGFMVGDYQLLHTTLIGGLRNPNWRALLYPGGKPENSNSRAEEYLQNR